VGLKVQFVIEIAKQGNHQHGNDRYHLNKKTFNLSSLLLWLIS